MANERSARDQHIQEAMAPEIRRRAEQLARELPGAPKEAGVPYSCGVLTAVVDLALSYVGPPPPPCPECARLTKERDAALAGEAEECGPLMPDPSHEPYCGKARGWDHCTCPKGNVTVDDACAKIDADEVLSRVRATTWDDEHDRETFAMSRPAALELLSRLTPAPRLSPEEVAAAARRIVASANAGIVWTPTGFTLGTFRAMVEEHLTRLSPATAAWTKEPKEPGWYWYRRPHGAPLLCYLQRALYRRLQFIAHGYDAAVYDVWPEGADFLGPIPVPEE